MINLIQAKTLALIVLVLTISFAVIVQLQAQHYVV